MILLLILAFIVPQVTIVGSLSDETGAPLAARVVELQSRHGTSLSPRVQATSDAAGHFSLQNAESGTWRIRIYTHPGDSNFSLLTDAFDLDDEDRTVRFVIPKAPETPPKIQPGVGYSPVPVHDRPTAPMVAGALVDVQSLRPLGHATIQFYLVSDESLSDPVHTVTSNDVGYFEVRSLKEGPYQIRVVADGYHNVGNPVLVIDRPVKITAYLLDEGVDLSSWATFRQPRASASWETGEPLDVILNPSLQSPWGTLTGRLMYEWGHSPNAMVELMSTDGTPLHRFLDARVEADGSFSIHSIAPSTYLLRVTIDDRVIDIPQVDIQPGDNELNVAL